MPGAEMSDGFPYTSDAGSLDAVLFIACGHYRDKVDIEGFYQGEEFVDNEFVIGPYPGHHINGHDSVEPAVWMV